MAKNTKDVSLDTKFFTQKRDLEKLYKQYAQEFANLNADNIKFYLESARKGINFFKGLLFEEIRRKDLRIAGLCQTRKLSVLSHDWKVDVEEGQSEDLKTFILDNFKGFQFDQFLCDMVEAQIQGLMLMQVSYELKLGKYYLKVVSQIPNYLTFYDGETRVIDLNKISAHDIRSQASSDTPRIPVLDIDPLYIFEAYSFDGNEENGLLNGLIDSTIWGYFFKSYGLKDWSVYLERFATPAVIGSYDTLMNKVDRIALETAVMNFGNLFKAVIPNTAKIDLLNDANKLSSSSIYSEYIKYWNDELSIRYLGQAMTTDTGQGGSYAKALVGNYVRQDIKAGDLSLITQSVNELIKKIIDINFPDVKSYPSFSFTTAEDIDSKVKKADLILKLKQAGYELSEEDAGQMIDMVLRQAQDDGQQPPDNNFSEVSPAKKKTLRHPSTSLRTGAQGKIIDEYIAELLAEMK